MSKLIFTALVFSANVMASGPCENMAKYGAIRAYMSEVGTIQGSDGIQYEAKLISSTENIFNYEVIISDNNEDGEYWDTTFQVRVKQRGTSCKVVSVHTDDL